MARWRTGRPEFRAACSCRALRGWGFECILLDREEESIPSSRQIQREQSLPWVPAALCVESVAVLEAEGFVSSVYILKWVLHDWSYERCGLILKNLHEAVASLSLEPGWPQGP
eukprot:g14080.t2